MRRVLLVTRALGLALACAATAWADGFVADPLTLVSGASPFAACTADNVATQPGRNFPNSEVEPWVDVNPTNPLNIVGTWQQDRWSNGGSRGVVAGVSVNGGITWKKVVIPGLTACSGNPNFLRASDPWLSFAPDGSLYHISLSVGINTSGIIVPSALLVSKSTDGGRTWSAPITIIQDNDPNVLNDKESITADPGDANLVYAVWDRLVIPQAQASIVAFEHAIGFRGPVLFSRTTNAGASWEAPRVIFDPGEVNQTIGNQIVVLPNGDLADAFNLIFNFKNVGHNRGFNVAVIRSADKGLTWSGPIIVAKLLSIGVTDPDTGALVRTGDIIPQIAVDRNPSSPGFGNLYAVWQDARFSNFTHDGIAFARSSDGGRTWSTPVLVNVARPDVAAFTPAVRVAANGTVGVTFYDFRNHVVGSPALETDYFLAHSHDQGRTWVNETRVTPASFDMRKAPVARGFFVGDYEALAVVGNDFKPFFVQSGAVQSAPGDPSDVFASTVGP